MTAKDRRVETPATRGEASPVNSGDRYPGQWLRSRVADAVDAEIRERAAQPEAKPLDGGEPLHDERYEQASDREWLRSECKSLAAEVRRLREENEQAYEYLSRLFLHHAPQCSALPNLLGVCTQIDNLSVCIPQLEAECESWRSANTALKNERDQLQATAANQAKTNGELAEWVNQLKAEVERLRAGDSK